MLLILGALSLVAQIVLLRELSVAFYGVELAYLLALATWMAGTAAGAAIGLPRVAVTTRRAWWLLAAAAAALPLDVALVRGSRMLAGAVPGAYLPFDRQIIVLGATTVPLALVMGIAFRWTARLAMSAGRPAAVTYAIESLGAALGGAAATVAIRAGAQTFDIAAASALATWAAMAVSSPHTVASASRPTRGPGTRWSTLGGAAVIAGIGVVALTVGPVRSFDRRMTAWVHPTMLDTRDSPYARITVTADAGQVVVFENDVLSFESQAVRQEELAHVSALCHPAPRRMLVVGGSLEQVDVELARHRPEHLTVVEIDRVRVEMAARHLARGHVPSRIVFADPRDFLTAGGPYDLIVVAMAEPTSGQGNRFFTREFFEHCAARMPEDGVLGVRLPLPEHVITPRLAARTASVVGALRAVFPEVEVFPGVIGVVVASRSPLPQSHEVLADRLRSRRIPTRLVTPPYLRYVFEHDRRSAIERHLASLPALPNSDARPAAYQHATLIWLTQFFPALVRVDLAVLLDVRTWPRAVQIGAFAVLAAGLVVCRARRRIRAAALALLAGLAGMLLETVLLLGYQASRGALFEDLGALVTAFMAGLALGAWVTGRNHERWLPHRRLLTALVFAGLALLCAAVASVVAFGVPLGLPGAASLLVVAGTLVSAAFACACAHTTRDPDGRIGALYAADLVGGCVASLGASLLLVPLTGIAHTAWIAACVSAAALTLLGD